MTSDQQIKELVESQKDLTKKLGLLLARDIGREFSAVEANVGSPPIQSAFTKFQNVWIPIIRANAFGDGVYQASCGFDVKRVSVKWRCTNVPGAAISPASIFLVATIGKEKSFTNYAAQVAIFPTVSPYNTNQNVVSGDITSTHRYDFSADIFTTYRYIKFSLYGGSNMAIASNLLNTTAVSTLFSQNNSSLMVEFSGN